MWFKMRILKKINEKDMPLEAGSLFLVAAATMQDHIKE